MLVWIRNIFHCTGPFRQLFKEQIECREWVNSCALKRSTNHPAAFIGQADNNFWCVPLMKARKIKCRHKTNLLAFLTNNRTHFLCSVREIRLLLFWSKWFETKNQPTPNGKEKKNTDKWSDEVRNGKCHQSDITIYTDDSEMMLLTELLQKPYNKHSIFTSFTRLASMP